MNSSRYLDPPAAKVVSTRATVSAFGDYVTLPSYVGRNYHARCSQRLFTSRYLRRRAKKSFEETPPTDNTHAQIRKRKRNGRTIKVKGVGRGGGNQLFVCSREARNGKTLSDAVLKRTDKSMKVDKSFIPQNCEVRKRRAGAVNLLLPSLFPIKRLRNQYRGIHSCQSLVNPVFAAYGRKNKGTARTLHVRLSLSSGHCLVRG